MIYSENWLESKLREIVTPDMVSLWIPSGQKGGIDLIGRNPKVQCFGTHPNVPVIAPPIDVLSDCDEVGDWTASAGGVLSIDEADKKQGTGCLVNTIASSSAGSWYSTILNPTGSWDWSDKEYKLLWFKCDRASTAFTARLFKIVDTSGNWRQWALTFSAGAWTAIKLSFSDGYTSTTPPDLASIDYAQVTFKAADTTAFYMKIDDFRLTAKPSLINTAVGWVFKTGDYINLGKPSSLNITDEISIGAWINPNTIVGTYGVVGRHSSGANAGGSIRPNGANIEVIINIGGVFTLFTTTDDPIVTHEWHYVEYTYNGSVEKIYVNTIEKATRENSGVIYTPVPHNVIGNLAIGNERAYNGYIALPFIANKGRSVAQVKNFDLATKDLFAPRG